MRHIKSLVKPIANIDHTTETLDSHYKIIEHAFPTWIPIYVNTEQCRCDGHYFLSIKLYFMKERQWLAENWTHCWR